MHPKNAKKALFKAFSIGLVNGRIAQGRLGFAATKAFVELVDTAASVSSFLLACVERVTARAHV